MDIVFLLEALVVLGAILMGTRFGGVAVGLWGGLGVGVLVFIFGEAPGDPPSGAVAIIMAVVTAAHDAGGRGHRLDGAGGRSRHREAPEADHADCAADRLCVLRRCGDQQHLVPVDAGDL